VGTPSLTAGNHLKPKDSLSKESDHFNQFREKFSLTPIRPLNPVQQTGGPNRALRGRTPLTLYDYKNLAMTQTPPQQSSNRIITWIRGFTLGCAVLGLLLSLVFPLFDITPWGVNLDNIPNWLGFTLLFIIGCYGFWEIRLLFQVQDSKDQTEHITK
jgi:hypothetical protein